MIASEDDIRVVYGLLESAFFFFISMTHMWATSWEDKNVSTLSQICFAIKFFFPSADKI